MFLIDQVLYNVLWLISKRNERKMISFQERVIDELKAALLRQQPDATLADEVKHLRAETKRKTDIIHGLTAEKNMYTSEMATMRVTQEVSITNQKRLNYI